MSDVHSCTPRVYTLGLGIQSRAGLSEDSLPWTLRYFTDGTVLVRTASSADCSVNETIEINKWQEEVPVSDSWHPRVPTAWCYPLLPQSTLLC
jgi:hypothetical protein